MPDTLVKNTVRHSVLSFSTPDTDPVQYTVRCEAPKDFNWSFNGLYETDARAKRIFTQRLGSELARQGIRSAYAPTVRRMSGSILMPSQFRTMVPLPNGVLMLRPMLSCDGTFIGSGEAFSMAAAGCILAALTFRNRKGEPACIVAHGGKASLVDLDLVFTGTVSRPYFGVIDAMVAAGIEHGGNPADMTFRSFFAKPWEDYRHSTDDPVYGEKNFMLVSALESRYGCEAGVITYDPYGDEYLSMENLAAAQARHAGIGNVYTEGYSLPHNGPFAYTTHQDPALADPMRNLVTLVRS